MILAALKYWREIGMGALLLACAVLFGLWKMEEAGRTKDRLAWAEAVTKAQARAGELSRQLLDQQEAHKRELQAATDTIKERIIRVPVSNACSASPAVRHAIDGVQQLLGPREPKAGP